MEDCGQETWTERFMQIEMIPDKPNLGQLDMRVIKTTFVMDSVLKTSYSLKNIFTVKQSVTFVWGFHLTLSFAILPAVL